MVENPNNAERGPGIGPPPIHFTLTPELLAAVDKAVIDMPVGSGRHDALKMALKERAQGRGYLLAATRPDRRPPQRSAFRS